jgi:hypothetical protein
MADAGAAAAGASPAAVPTGMHPVLNPAADPSLTPIFSCRKCRAWLFRPDLITRHTVRRAGRREGGGQLAWGGRKRGGMALPGARSVQQGSPPARHSALTRAPSPFTLTHPPPPPHPPPLQLGKHRFTPHRFAKDIASGHSAGVTRRGIGGTRRGGAAVEEDEEEGGGGNEACTSFFLSDALQWMRSASADVEGKLVCYGCGARVGILKWQGSQCSCGTWVNPAIQLYKKALDERFVPRAAAAPAAAAAATAVVAREEMEEGEGAR